jgi:xylono-1,5-lactonase
MIQIKSNVNLALPEGVLWNSSLQCYEFVDIDKGSFYRFFLDKNLLIKIKVFNSNLSWIFPCHDNINYICGAGNQVIIWNSIDDESTPLFDLDLFLDQRLNDAYIDYYGVLWFNLISSQPFEYESNGSLYSYRAGLLSLEDSDYFIPNGPIVTIDRSRMLHSDSAKGLLYSFDYYNGKIDINSKSIVFDSSNIDGSPDGMCLDGSGNIYIAMWGLGEVWMLNTSLEISKKFSIPFKFVTNVAFGGKNLDRLLVTYAEDQALDISGGLYLLEGHNAAGLPSGVWQI